MNESANPLPYQSKEPATPPKLRCSKCGERMEQGVIGAAHLALVWTAGEIHCNFLGRHLPGGTKYEVVTFRCVGCGFLESYSPPG